MPNNIVMRQIEVTAEYRPLSPERLVGTFDVSAPPTNSAPVYFRGDTGEDVVFLGGEYHRFANVDLAHLWVRGDEGGIITVIGTTGRE